MAKFDIKGLNLEIPDRFLTPVLREELRTGSYEWGEARALGAVLRKGDHLLDLGSAIGFIASLAAQTLDDRNITCIEANPELIPVLERNLAQNGAPRAGLIHGAVVGGNHRSEQVTLELRPAFYSSRLSSETSDGKGRLVEVPALHLSDLLVAFEPDVVTMDLEGVEAGLAVLPWPGKVRAVVMELHTKYYDLSTVDEIFAGMARNGFAYQPRGSRGDVVVFQRIGTE
ncbi:FkbM family methyltransferase [Aliiroseovarius sp. KMU-50]|uniref:FkbM family methyltransferase n=1 Tax=Aliiroseovarius salicola TaxID=3009082 RepID=A0ABT4W4U6_9RHOB|nr:FkbM family methyltransferase [Aliiroseovarius sp. KMU-50]MDA5095531.1 FkbM family methyltransferase [Aliiroseovarius sp. KMU-50]